MSKPVLILCKRGPVYTDVLIFVVFAKISFSCHLACGDNDTVHKAGLLIFGNNIELDYSFPEYNKKENNSGLIGSIIGKILNKKRGN